MMNRIFGSIAVVSALAFGAGCGGTEFDEAQPMDLESTTQAAEEPQHKPDDLIAALDRTEGVLYAREDMKSVALRELQASPVDATGTTFVTKDPLTGEATKFSIKPFPGSVWPLQLKVCSNGQVVMSWQVCPTLIMNDPLTRVWMNAACNWRVQSASTSSCVNTTSGSSYKYQYLESWKCGVGIGFCVERRAAMVVRTDYVLASCDPSLISSVQSSNYNYLCKH